MDKTWKNKWQTLKDNAKQKGRFCGLSLVEYIQLAKDAGILDPNLIGKSVDSYQLGRIGDTGDYILGNCRFISMKQNLDERRINGGDLKIATKKLGRTKYNDASVLSGSIKMSGRRKDTHPGIFAQSEFISKSFVLTDDKGVEHFGHNLAQFCRDNNLNQGNMSAVCRGAKQSHKGWTGKYIKE